MDHNPGYMDTDRTMSYRGGWVWCGCNKGQGHLKVLKQDFKCMFVEWRLHLSLIICTFGCFHAGILCLDEVKL